MRYHLPDTQRQVVGMHEYGMRAHVQLRHRPHKRTSESLLEYCARSSWVSVTQPISLSLYAEAQP